jgi:hypothetical protein
MSTNINIPFFPDPPREYNQAYMAQVIRAFALFAQQVRNPGEGRNTFIVLTNLQQADSGLEVGALYRHGNELRITLPNTAAIAGVSGTAYVGSVSVTTT